MTTENTIAQVPATGTDNAQANTSIPAPQPAPGAQQFEGFQKRIDELTAKSHAKDAQIEAMMAQQQQLLMNLATRQQEPAPQAPSFEGLDPEVRRAIEYNAAQQKAAMDRQLAQLAAQSSQVQLQGMLAAEHPLVKARAAAIWADAVSKGAHTQGFTPESAIMYARGQMYPEIIKSAGQSAQVQQGAAFNTQAPVIAGQSVVPPSAAGSSQSGAAPDPEDDPEGASAFYAKRLGDKAF